MKTRVLLLSTVHPATDPRIVYKIASSLASQYDVLCILPRAKKTVDQQNIRMFSLPRFQNLFLRLLFSHPVAIWKCLVTRPALVHIFVPELIPMAFLLHWSGIKVIYEVQENLYKKFSIKTFNNHWFYQFLFRFFDHAARKSFNLIFTEPAYLKEYLPLKKPYAVIHNYVSLPFADRYAKPRENHELPTFLYSGVISMERCFDTLVAALVKLKSVCPGFQVNLFGPVRFTDQEAEMLPGYSHIKQHLRFYGYQDLKEVLGYAGRSIAGIALLKPVADYPESYTSKLFEYMALKLPVVTSDFPLYKQVVEKAACGFCISPTNADSLFQKLHWLIQNREAARQMGQNGRHAAEEKYNWTSEEKTLLSFYQKILIN